MDDAALDALELFLGSLEQDFILDVQPFLIARALDVEIGAMREMAKAFYLA